MLIRCPECQFEREIDTDKIPASASVATCPKCGERFRFRDPQSGEFVRLEPRAESVPLPPERLPTEQDGDDPLPPGAIIPDFQAAEPKVPKVESRTEPKSEHDPSLELKGKQDQEKAKFEFNLGGMLDKLNKLLPPKKEAQPAQPQLFPPKQEDEDEEGSPLAWREDWSKGVPWENPDDYGLFSGLYHTILGALFRTRDFFTHVWSTQPLTMAAIFYVLLNYFATIITNVWGLLPVQGLNLTADVSMARAMGMSVPLMLIMLPFFQLLAMFLQSGLYHLMIRLVQPEEADFPTTARVIAYSSAPMVLAVVPFIGSLIGSVWSIVLTFVGCKYAHNLSWGRTALALVPLFILEFVISYQVLATIASAISVAVV